MLLEELERQLLGRFNYEKRAVVCLWFDEQREFAPLAVALAERLGKRSDPPFLVLAYDAARRRGQLWLKHAISTARSAESRAGKFVVHLPFSPDAELALLQEYRLAGVTWRIDGKAPTLFRFLRSADVPLPSEPGEQRRLWDGGRDSVLSKYAARFADKPRRFWTDTTLTPELARERLLGDLDGRILDLALDPATAWEGLRSEGIEREFADAVAANYGYVSTDAPEGWLNGLAEQIALTDTHAAFGEPDDFPFADRLPPPGLRERHRQLLGRWLRDRDAQAAWERVIAQVEPRIDLSEYGRSRAGLAFAFPHLVSARWQRAREAFEAAAGKASDIATFIAGNAHEIQAEAAHARASERPVGAWPLLDDLRALLSRAAEAEQKARTGSDLVAVVALYVRNAAGVDGLHVRVRAAAERHELPAAAHVADRAYAGYTNTLNTRFFELLAASGSLELPDVPPVGSEVSKHCWQTSGRRAVLIVDALRYDCAEALRDALTGGEVEIKPVRASLPTITPVGMTALLPTADEARLEVAGSSLRLRIDGRDMAVRQNRIRALEEMRADCRDVDEVERGSRPPADLGDLLVVLGHDSVDQLGHDDAGALIRHLEVEIARLARLVERLHGWGYPEVHVVTDHGFVLLDEERLPEEVRCDRSWCRMLKPRFALVPAAADLPLTTFPLASSEELRVAVPPGLAFFRAERAFSHGGAALQELVIPHLVSRRGDHERPIDVEVSVAATELVQTVVRVVLRPVRAAGQLSLTAERGRVLTLDVTRDGESILADGLKRARLEPGDEEVKTSLFFGSATALVAGESLELEVRDTDTGERFPAAGSVTLTVARDM